MSLPPRRVSASAWQPVGVNSLEPNALTVVRSSSHHSVLAGPGAGKTELLAQRAAFLLQTGASPKPQRILAISFKRDAARNLARRVRQRCHQDQASRFDSLTFDAFAKGLVDRFGQALPDRWRPSSDYELIFPKRPYWPGFLSGAARASDNPFDEVAVRGLNAATFERRFVLADRLPEAGWSPATAGLWAGHRFWDDHLHGRAPSQLTFAMLTRLAELMVRVNSAVRSALALTYSHVFMDEYQDTTQAQLDLVHAIFLGTSTVMTAVGDNKQQIMRFALAMDAPFEAFEQSFGAQRIPLVSNYRSSPQLVQIQHVLARALDNTCVAAQSMAPATINGACCSIWDFTSEHAEANTLAQFVASEMVAHQLRASDFVLMVRQEAESYVPDLAPAFAAAGIPLRNEAAYVGDQMLQELMTEPLSDLVMLMLRLACGSESGAAWNAALQALAELRGVSQLDDLGRRKLARDLDDFATQLSSQHPHPPQDESQAKDILTEVVAFLGRAAVIASHEPYQQGGWIGKVERSAAIHLANSAASLTSWPEALDAYQGADAIPLMTLHKSKGLEYHTVIFLGLDDKAWWSFKKDPQDGLAGFFVAFTRAKQQAIFTYAKGRGNKTEVQPLYQLLASAGVQTIAKA